MTSYLYTCILFSEKSMYKGKPIKLSQVVCYVVAYQNIYFTSFTLHDKTASGSTFDKGLTSFSRQTIIKS